MMGRNVGTCDGQKPLQVVRQVSRDDLQVEDVQLEPKERTIELLHDPGR